MLCRLRRWTDLSITFQAEEPVFDSGQIAIVKHHKEKTA